MYENPITMTYSYEDEDNHTITYPLTRSAGSFRYINFFADERATIDFFNQRLIEDLGRHE